MNEDRYFGAFGEGQIKPMVYCPSCRELKQHQWMGTLEYNDYRSISLMDSLVRRITYKCLTCETIHAIEERQ